MQVEMSLIDVKVNYKKELVSEFLELWKLKINILKDV